MNIVTWICDGKDLNGPGAIFGMAFIVHMVLTPLAATVAKRFAWNFSGPAETVGVTTLSVVLVSVLGLITGSVTSLNAAVTLGLVVSNTAMGIDITRKTINKDKPAQ